LLLLIPVFWLKTETSAIYISGFSISALEVILLLSFQIVFGYVYAASGIIISSCMAGLAVGAIAGWRRNINPNKYAIIVCQLMIGILAALSIWLISKTSITWNNSMLYLVFFLAVIVPSVFAGFQFSLMVKRAENIIKLKANRLYAADLFGAALGAASVTLILLPVFGIQSVIFVIVILNLLAVLLLVLKKS
jgi:spermidine synthase